MFKQYDELIDPILLESTKPVKMLTASPLTILKIKDLIVPYLAWKFINIKKEVYFPIDSLIHKPEEVINEEMTDPIEISNLISCKMYNTNNIYTVFYISNSSRTVSGASFSNIIVSAYEIVSHLFVRCKVRFICKEPPYVALESYHGPDVLVSLQDIFSKYGRVDDKVYKRRMKKCLKIEETSNVHNITDNK